MQEGPSQADRAMSLVSSSTSITPFRTGMVLLSGSPPTPVLCMPSINLAAHSPVPSPTSCPGCSQHKMHNAGVPAWSSANFEPCVNSVVPQVSCACS
jgi:hypothetical protein